MKDELEKYILENQSNFDDFVIDEVDKSKLWSKIESELEEKPKVFSIWEKPILKIAASIMLLVGCLFTFFIFNQNNIENNIVNQELFEIDSHYKFLVNNHVKLVRSNTNLSKLEQEDFLLLLEDLDKEYNKLKTDLKEDVNNERIIEAIINNYRKKIQLMVDLLERSYPTKNNFDDGEFIL